MNKTGSDIPSIFRAGRYEIPLGRRTYIMGILNVTPDSFSDGGRYLNLEQAVQRAGEMLAQGADIIDIGGESTRPGYTPVDAEQELSRVIPVIERITREYNCPISIDTVKPVVADAALAAGACIVNDINGLQGDPDMAAVAARHQAGVIIMHNARLYRDESVVPNDDLMSAVVAFLHKSCQIASAAGIQTKQLMIDPGVGFGVTPEESIEMIAQLQDLQTLGLPILLGPSRKRFIGTIMGDTVTDRLSGTGAAVALGIANGAGFVRVHDVREMVEVARVADAICRAATDREGRA